VEPYHIHTEVFEGPLDVLLTLIEKRKLLINDIALAEVADDFLKFLERHQDFPVAETAQFVLIGSTLLLIKSKSLLPVLSLTEEEQTSIEDLQQRLKLLDTYKALARTLLAQYQVQPLFSRRRRLRRTPTFSPDSSMTIDNLHGSIRTVLANLPELKPTLAQATVEKVVSLEEMMSRLSDRINASMQVSFREFSGLAPEGKVNVIVSFLAMLELVRQGVIRVEQSAHFGEITMHADNVGLPHYG